MDSAVDAALTVHIYRRTHDMSEPIVSTLRVRIGREEVHYGQPGTSGADVLEEPVVVVRATGTTVVPMAHSRGPRGTGRVS